MVWRASDAFYKLVIQCEWRSCSRCACCHINVHAITAASTRTRARARTTLMFRAKSCVTITTLLRPERYDYYYYAPTHRLVVVFERVPVCGAVSCVVLRGPR